MGMKEMMTGSIRWPKYILNNSAGEPPTYIFSFSYKEMYKQQRKRYVQRLQNLQGSQAQKREKKETLGVIVSPNR